MKHPSRNRHSRFQSRPPNRDDSSRGGFHRFQRGGDRFSSGPGGRRPNSGRSHAEESFLSKTSIDPRVRLRLEGGSSDLTMRAMDLLCPIGKGQRGLIVSPPKAGKTTFLKQICISLAKIEPTLKLYCLLIDERPEEVTDFKRSVSAEVFASPSDRSYEEHIQVAQNLMTQAIAQADTGKDVVILLDSLTRLARVHNQNADGNKTMSGGL